jgi:peptide/nickel transport system permease protein
MSRAASDALLAGPAQVRRPLVARMLSRAGRFARRKPLGAVGAVVLMVLVFVAVFAPLIAPYDPHEFITGARLKPPSADHLMGTNAQSRDMFSRILFGARLSLQVAMLSVGLGTALGTTVGLVSGYFGGAVDLLIQRLIDIMLAFPLLILLIALVAMLGQSIENIIVALAVGSVPGTSRIVRGAVLSVRQEPYVEAARSLGARPVRILSQHILPNVSAPIIVISTSALGGIILAETSLSFLGFGPPVTTPSWGKMLSGDARIYMTVAPWLGIFPGLAISIVVFSANMLGDAVRDVLDPRLRST